MTIYINKNEENICLFSLNESTKTIFDGYVDLGYIIPNYIESDNDFILPNYILQLESKVSNDSKILWLNNDVSLNKNRINRFIIEEVSLSDQDLDNQKVYLEVGSYNYYVWETISDILDIEVANKIIESGMLHCIGEDIPIVVANIPRRNINIYKKNN